MQLQLVRIRGARTGCVDVGARLRRVIDGGARAGPRLATRIWMHTTAGPDLLLFGKDSVSGSLTIPRQDDASARRRTTTRQPAAVRNAAVPTTKAARAAGERSSGSDRLPARWPSPSRPGQNGGEDRTPDRVKSGRCADRSRANASQVCEFPGAIRGRADRWPGVVRADRVATASEG